MVGMPKLHLGTAPDKHVRLVVCFVWRGHGDSDLLINKSTRKGGILAQTSQ